MSNPKRHNARSRSTRINRCGKGTFHWCDFVQYIDITMCGGHPIKFYNYEVRKELQ